MVERLGTDLQEQEYPGEVGLEPATRSGGPS
jgi:hypothetical protein